jgi:hypothetical protein
MRSPNLEREAGRDKSKMAEVQEENVSAVEEKDTGGSNAE